MDRVARLPGGPRDQQVLTWFRNFFRNCGDLCGGFTRPVHDLRKPLSNTSMMIDPGEPEVLVGRLAQILKELFMRQLRCGGAGPNVVQQCAELKTVHGWIGGGVVDLFASRAVILSFVL